VVVEGKAFCLIPAGIAGRAPFPQCNFPFSLFCESDGSPLRGCSYGEVFCEAQFLLGFFP